ncbi:MAG TPA: HNH endonuclease signature motif containing protein [Saprospiraceae bacterium]|nr:HNH endonuclease signature motif containing protein [Saprospiraceae bacterium]
MPKQKYPSDFIQLIGTITNKRAKIVIDHIMEHGFITTRDLETKYGYSHPPRAARDVREAGIPLETFSVKSEEGKSIAAYKFGDLTQIQHNKFGGRKLFSKEFKSQLYALSGGKCAICNGSFEERYLQIDHRVPYEISGDSNNFQQNIDDYMLLCGSCNRAKSWSCEHCDNWTVEKEIEFCLKCYWGNPNNYDHIALQEIRRLELVWQDNEIKFFEALKKEADEGKLQLPEHVKNLIEKHLKKE